MEINKTYLRAAVITTKSKHEKPIEPTQIVENNLDVSGIDISLGTNNEEMIDVRKVEALKEKIQNGNYSFDLKGIAEAIVDLNE